MPLVNKTFPEIITFSRASAATMFDSSGTLVYAPMNLLSYSEAFNTTPNWATANSSVTADATTSPASTVTADKLIEALDVSQVHQITQTITVVSLATYTVSVFVKADTRTKVRIGFIVGGASGVIADADLTAGTIGAPSAFGGGVAVSSSIQSINNGWYRISITGSGAAGTSGEVRVELLDASGNRQYNGDGTSGLYIWGAQTNIANMQGGVTADLSTYYPTTSAAYQGPRFDYDPATLAARGFLIEEARTNSIRNNTMQGAVAGTPGTPPTNWVGTGSPANGLTREIVGTGTENGITYIDYRFSGTTSAASFHAMNPETIGVIAALAGQSWTYTSYISVVAGSTANINAFAIVLNEYSSVPAFLAGSSAVITISTGALVGKRYSFTRVLTNASTASVHPFFAFTYNNGVAIDITLRIGLPQLEQGAFATSVIPTTTTALTRSADVASVDTLSPWFNASEGSLLTQFSIPAQSSATTIATIGDGTANERIILNVATNRAGTGLRVVDGGVDQCDINLTASFSAGQSVKTIVAYAVNDFAVCQNGGSVGTDTSGTLPTVTALYIGQNGVGSTTNSHIQRITYYPRRLSDAELQAITA